LLFEADALDSAREPLHGFVMTDLSESRVHALSGKTLVNVLTLVEN
jgi:hypothetical protein